MHSAARKGAIDCIKAGRPGFRTSHFRCGSLRKLSLLETGIVHAAISLHGAIASETWSARPARDRLPSVAILLSRVGRGRWPSCVRFAGLPETPATTARRLRRKNGMDTEAELNWLGRPMGCNGEGAEILAWDGRLDNRDDLTLVLKDRLRECAGDVAIVQATYE